MQKQVFLVLDDGTVFRGSSFGAPAPAVSELESAPSASEGPGIGEVVFNTGMSGYHEILTDPSYTGQLVIMTYPHIGNYGDDEQWSESASGAAGLIVRSVYRGSVPRGRRTLHEFMASRGIPGISDIDTRALTLKIRTNGNPKGLIVSSTEGRLTPAEIDRCIATLAGYPDMEGRDLVSALQGRAAPDPISAAAAGPAAPADGGGGPSGKAGPSGTSGLHVALIDFGYKANIVRELQRRGCRVTVLPATASAGQVRAAGAEAVLLSNGPGDPAVLSGPIRLARELAERYPLFGICLGHQIISLAFGAQTFKMRFGHHGLNHPVRDEDSGRVYITSQNHGFAVQAEQLPPDLEVWMRNANDQTIEGMRHRQRPAASVQFHPEAAPGPQDTLWVFDEFLSIAAARG
ncbi:MAG: glutamine-hydrolyzing carbamoyl-phosphate synthase small subunit [bacterium]